MVVPDEILTKKVSACNQITIIFNHLLSHRNIVFRPVGLNNHMVTEVKYNGSWHMFDPDYEPQLNHAQGVDALLQDRDIFHAIYRETNGKFFNNSFDKILLTEDALYFDKNVLIAQNLSRFQYITGFLSRYGWLLFLLIGLILHLLK